jgi:excisionase family DNA binding protein
MKRYYSSRELAEYLAVNESTVKRWSDGGAIECIRTRGGHRRFPLQSVLRFVQENKMEVPDLAAQVFAQQEVRTNLVAGNTDVLAPKLRSAALVGGLADALSILRAAMVSKPDVLALYEDVVFPVLRQIGNDWAAGAISIDQEHLATQTIKDAIVRLQSSLHQEPSTGGSALLACYEGETHDIVLQCIASYLAVKGWRIVNLGQNTPTRSLVEAIRRHKPSLVVVSALIVIHDRKFLRDLNQVVLRAAHRSGAKLVVGGTELRSKFGNRLKADLVSESMRDIEVFVQSHKNRS